MCRRCNQRRPDQKLTPMQEFKLAAISQEVSEAVVLDLFLRLEISSEDDIMEACGILRTYRPDMFRRLEQLVRS